MRLIRVEAERLADADVAPSLALTREQVSREAARVTAALDERARMNGYAQTEIATEDDDWLKLDLYLELEGASSVAALPPEAANEWARRMAAHERLRLASGGSIEER